MRMSKNQMAAVLLAALLLAGCGHKEPAESQIMETAAIEAKQTESIEAETKMEESHPTPAPEATSSPASEPEAEAPAEETAVPEPAEERRPKNDAPFPTPAAETEPSVEAPAPAAEINASAPAAPAPAPRMSYGGIPFDLAAGTEQWWQIDSSDSAYWAVQENINAIRAAAGLGPLRMDGGLSAIAGGRCQSFVAGGQFDHSGMVTASEICASGPLGSASAVCSAWQASPAHYAAMTGNFTCMGVGCWFCSTAEGNYTYWCVTFA